MSLTMKQLRYFEALARHRHFGRAAAACAISQPALSIQMKELEAVLGSPLIEKTPRGILLTGLGAKLAERAAEILRDVDEITDLARVAHGPLAGRLRLGVIPTIAPYLLPQVVQDLSEAYPDLDLLPRETVTQRLVEDLLEGRLDAAIVALPVSDPALHEQPLFDEEFALVRHASEANEPVPGPEMLREMRLLLLEEGHCFRDQALAVCHLSSSLPRELMEGNSLTTLVQMVGAGIGITLIPEMAVSIETRATTVSVARLPAPRPTRTIGMIWRKSSPLADQLRHIADLVLRASQTS